VHQMRTPPSHRADGVDAMTRHKGEITRPTFGETGGITLRCRPKIVRASTNRPSITLNVPGSAVSDRDLPIYVFFRTLKAI
jgi:hypothetical protein